MDNNLDQAIQKTWLRTESRTIRPFLFSDELLKSVAFRLTSEDEFSELESVHKEELDRDLLSPELKINLSAQDLVEQLDIDPTLLRLIISIEDKALKKCEVVYEEKIKDLSEFIIKLPKSTLSDFSWLGDTKLRISLVLAENRAGAIGKASIAGHWLAKKEFSIGKIKDTARFPITIIKPEKFKELFGLPPETTYYVDILTDDLNQPLEDIQNIVNIYITESVNNVLSREETTQAGRALNLLIYCDTAATILSYGFSQLENDTHLIEDSILSLVANTLAKETGISINKIIEMAKQPGGSKLRALIQTQISLTRSLKSIGNRR